MATMITIIIIEIILFVFLSKKLIISHLFLNNALKNVSSVILFYTFYSLFARITSLMPQPRKHR